MLNNNNSLRLNKENRLFVCLQTFDSNRKER